jgi:hypothetical protein
MLLAIGIIRNSAFLWFVIFAVDFVTHHCKIALDVSSASVLKVKSRPILLTWVFVLEGLVGGTEKQFEVQGGRGCLGIRRRPIRRVDDEHVGHLRSSRFAISAERQAI